MNWKQFLKSDWRRNLIFIIIVISSLLLYSYNVHVYNMGPSPDRVGGPAVEFDIYTVIFIALNFVFLTYLITAINFSLFNASINIVIGFALNLLFWYAFSYFLVMFYERCSKKVGVKHEI